MVYNYGNRLCFKFNVSKSAVLVFAEGRKEHDNHSTDRIFKLGNDNVKERTSYDHVGVKPCHLSEDESCVLEKIRKGSRTQNASAGLGIRNYGLNMMTCNKIFWHVVVPTL